MSLANLQPLGADLLTTLVFLPALGALVLAFLPGSSKAAAKAVALSTSVLTFGVSVFLYRRFDPGTHRLRLWVPRDAQRRFANISSRQRGVLVYDKFVIR